MPGMTRPTGPRTFRAPGIDRPPAWIAGRARNTKPSGLRVRGLDGRVELRGVAALLARAVARTLAAAERHVVVHARRRQVDHHYAGLRIPLEVRRVFQRRRRDAGRQAELGVVGERQRLVVVLGADHAHHRPEDLLAVDAHARLRFREEGRREIEARRARGVLLDALATGHQLRALALADRQVLEVLVQLAFVDHRADVGAGLARNVDLQRLHLGDHRLDEAVVDAGGDDHARGR